MYAYGATCQYAILSSMFLLRCWALYDKKMLFGGLVGVAISGIIIAHSIVYRASFRVNPLPNIFSGCVMQVPDYLWATYVMPLAYEFTVLLLTIWRIYTLSKDVGATPLLQMLAQNGVAYFVTLVLLVTIGCIGGKIEAVKIATNGSGVVCSRMIFSLYEINDKETRIHSDIHSSPSDSMPQFAIPLRSLASTQHTTHP
ncbi:hypothetical protein B0J17DRAFT_675981 [Rhizoctonia solani]|nr:hypothetical protein B0J17DRAFT_675981 [Rhizoctonia solani]